MKVFYYFLVIALGAFVGFSNRHIPKDPLVDIHQDLELEPTPTIDRMAVPLMPDNPSHYDIGLNLYFHYCMPCHGDYGQGLTDEFREAWVDDHQNCWADGCHGGRPMDEGFVIPRYIPPVVGTYASQPLITLADKDSLINFLDNKHPPQNPGVLGLDESRDITLYLMVENGELDSSSELVRDSANLSRYTVVFVAVICFIVIGMSIYFLLKKYIKQNRKRQHQETGEEIH